MATPDDCVCMYPFRGMSPLLFFIMVESCSLSLLSTRARATDLAKPFHASPKLLFVSAIKAPESVVCAVLGLIVDQVYVCVWVGVGG